MGQCWGNGWPAGTGLGSLLLPLLSFLFYFFRQKYKKERVGEKGEELEKYKNKLMILKMCSI